MEKRHFCGIIIRRLRLIEPHERRTAIPTKTLRPEATLATLEKRILSSLDSHKAEDIVSLNLEGKSDFADRMIIANGTSLRHVGALADHVVEVLENAGCKSVRVEGKEGCEWVLVDAGDIVVHLFKPEVRSYYNLEKMWSVSLPAPAEATY